MRELKFRAFINRNMYYSFECGVGGNLNLLEILPGIDYDSVMQYTGLKDKNGKEIYEGDIVSILGNKTYEVTFHHGGWRIGADSLWQYSNSECWELTIIGNIYENPDLIDNL